MEMIDELKYSPDGKLLAVGSHDNYIDVYATTSYEVGHPYTSIGTPDVLVAQIRLSDAQPACLGNHPFMQTPGHAHRMHRVLTLLCLSPFPVQPVRRLKGHTSYVTHLDWSKDSKVLQSNCGAYEIIYWDVKVRVSRKRVLDKPDERGGSYVRLSGTR